MLPAFREQIQLNRRRRRLDINKLGSAGKKILYSFAQLQAAFIQQDNGKGRTDPLKFSAQGKLRKLHLQLCCIESLDHPGETEFSAFANDADESFVFAVNEKRVTDRGMRGSALGCIDRYLTGNKPLVQKRRRDFAQLFVVHGDS